MAQSLAKVLIHLIFSTKGRRRLIAEDVRDELNAYLVGIPRNCDSPPLRVNCVEDHVHLLFSLSRNHAIKTIVEQVKKGSSKWIKTKGPRFGGFYWQNGYGAFSVSPSNVESVGRYIRNQNEHHRTVSFQEEFRRFLDKHGLDYDERYLWD